jgi:choline dehydrogenase
LNVNGPTSGAIRFVKDSSQMPTELPRYADTIVVGGGTAGAAVAGILTERSDQSVLLLEAGPDYGSYDSGRWPSDLLEAFDLAASHSWGYDSGEIYQERIIPFERARVIGGCSSHNGCAAIWGHRADYDGWAALGNDGWSTNDLLPYFESVNRRMRVRIPAPNEITPFHQAMLAAAPGAGIPIVNDLNDLDEPIGMAPSPANIWNGIRWNSAFAYLDPVRGRSNLTIRGDVLIDKLVIERGRVVGVQAVGPNGLALIEAGRVVLSGGTYGSPQILLRSGIGDETELAKADIRTAHPLAGVGQNLHDHSAAYLQFSGTDELIERMTAFGREHWMPEEQTIAKARSSQCSEAFDLHIYPEGGPYAQDRTAWSFIMPVACMTPRSRGRLTIRNADPESAPIFEHGYLSDVDRADIRVLADGIELGRAMTNQPDVRRLIGEEIAPGAGIASRTDLEAWIDRVVVHYYHPVGTCKMGPASDPAAVVDPRGKVHGIDGCYVADCSVMPVIPRANTNIPAAVTGERIAGWLAES